jgi:hypothetical protein
MQDASVLWSAAPELRNRYDLSSGGLLYRAHPHLRAAMEAEELRHAAPKDGSADAVQAIHRVLEQA